MDRNERATRLRLFREATHTSQSAFAESLGIPRTTLINYEKGTLVPADVLLPLKEKYELNIDWFLTGKGPMFTGAKFPTVGNLEAAIVSDSKTETVHNLPDSGIPPPLQVVRQSEIEGKHFLVPLLDQKVSAGNGATLPDKDVVVSYIPAPLYLSRFGNNVAALQVRGDSMEPTLKDGDLVVCDTYGWQGDGIYVIRMDGEGFVKRLTRRPGRLVVLSDNGAYHPFEESLESQALSVVGRVRCAVRKME